MRTEKEQKLINKLVHNIDQVTLEEMQLITGEMLNSKINDGYMSEWSVALALALSPEGRVILALNNNALALQINAESLNANIQHGEIAGWSMAFVLANCADGRAILTAQDNTLALRINEERLHAVIRQGSYSGWSAAYALVRAPEGRAILEAIEARHKNNNIMLALYSAKVSRLGKYSKIRVLQRELIGNVLTMLDGRTPQKLSLK